MSLKDGTSLLGNEEDHSRLKGEMNTALLDFYLCPEQFVDFEISGQLSTEAGYFRFAQSTCLTPRSASGYRASRPDPNLYDVINDVTVRESKLSLPFDPDEVIDNLRLERYAKPNGQGALTRWERSLKANLLFSSTIHACQAPKAPSTSSADRMA